MTNEDLDVFVGVDILDDGKIACRLHVGDLLPYQHWISFVPKVRATIDFRAQIVSCLDKCVGLFRSFVDSLIKPFHVWFQVSDVFMKDMGCTKCHQRCACAF